MKKLLFFLFIMRLGNIFGQISSFEIQGHRGARGLMPENTIPAFLRAIDEGVQTLEMDVVISKDRKVVTSHEPYFNPLFSLQPDGQAVKGTNQGNLYQLNYKEIKKYDVGSKKNPLFPEQANRKAYKPLLREVIKQAEHHAKARGIRSLKYNIELKSDPNQYGISQPDVRQFSDLVVQEIQKLSPAQVIIQSFDFEILKHWEQEIKVGKYPKVSLSVLIEPEANNEIVHNLEKLGFLPDIWSPYFKTLNENRIKTLHEKGIRVIPWTVNAFSDMEKIRAMGCDGLITDYPNRAKGL